MIQFTYNNITYNVANHATIADRLKQRELLELPLEGWKELLTVGNGKVDEESLRQGLIGKVKNIDNSKEFEYKGKKLWWDKSTRAGLLNLANSSTDNVAILIGDDIISFNLESLKDLLAQLEVYSSKCLIVTHKHIKAIEKLQTFEDILKYNYTLGYPDKVVIE